MSIGSGVDEGSTNFVRQFLSSAGKVIIVEEELQDAVTATSGSGPAYFFAFIEAMIEGGKKLGLPEKIASQLAIQTIVGAAEMLATSGKDPATLRENVTSPNGTTHAALTTFQSHNLKNIVADAMAAAEKRSQELA